VKPGVAPAHRAAGESTWNQTLVMNTSESRLRIFAVTLAGWAGRLRRDRRGAVAPLMALALPAVFGAAALAVDAGFYYVEQQRLQVAADAAAYGAALLLPNQPSTSELQSAALQAAQDASGSSVIGTLATPVTVSTSGSTVTVTLTSKADGFLAAALSLAAPTLTATATAGTKPGAPCVLALNPSAPNAIEVDNMGAITASGCGIFSNSSASVSGQNSGGAIYLNSGTISAPSVGAVGSVNESNSGSNTLSPSDPTNNAAPQQDPYSGKSPPSPGSCSYPSGTSFTAWKSTPYQFAGGTVFCGNTTIGGNGSSDEFAPGIYYVVNGSLTFNNATITQAAGVTFVLTGSSPGAFTWTNYSNTPTQMSAPTSGPTAGMLVWQTCGSGGSPTSLINDPFAGGSTLQVSGNIYMPCGALNLSNNAHLNAAPGADMSVIADTINVVGSAGIDAASGGSSGSGASKVVLMQ
jgi:Flp pilus assembly protein TadG